MEPGTPGLQGLYCLPIVSVQVDVDEARFDGVQRAQNFLDEDLARSSIVCGAEPEVERIARSIHGAILIYRLAFDLDLGFIDLPRVLGRPQLRLDVLSNSGAKASTLRANVLRSTFSPRSTISSSKSR